MQEMLATALKMLQLYRNFVAQNGIELDENSESEEDQIVLNFLRDVQQVELSKHQAAALN